ncbi:MAG: ParB N-terminal domain-containing protein [Pseudorhizobium pelagicum]|uniref:ParB N-terminal domain-containing protein n=1 Tax=Pseudorhizobium pelagicum TaxID=1509405 RepID=UPI0034603E92
MSKITYIGEHGSADLARMPFGKALQALLEAETLPSNPARRVVSAPYFIAQVEDVFTIENVFQHRDREAGKFQSEAHVKLLVNALQNLPAGERVLDPLLLKSIDNVWVCVDGHHRLKAYEHAGITEFPAVEFRGTLREAVVEAGRSNAKTKLPLQAGERMEAAWRIVAAKLASKAETRKATGVSDGSIANMRRMVKRLQERDIDASLLRYHEAKDTLNDIPRGARGEAWAEEQIAQIADKLSRTLAKTGHRNREFIAEAMERLYPSVVETIVERNAIRHRQMIEALYQDEDCTS